MTEFEYKKRALQQALWAGKIEINFFHNQMAVIEKNNERIIHNNSDFADISRKPNTRGYRPPVKSMKRRGNF